MPFNLKDFMAKTAGKASLDQTTEAQLGNKGKGPNVLGEAQLDAKREGGPNATTQKQLDAVREGKESTELTEGQFGKRKPAGTAAVSEKQLDDERTPHCEGAVEKRLDKVRVAADVSVTEGQLGKRDGKGPGELSEAQLEDQRVDKTLAMIERQLEKVRTGTAQKLTEAQMDDSKSKLVKHRNPDAAMGDINKLEEQRLAAKKTAEGEKYEAASTTPKDKMLPQPKSPDGLKVATRAVSAQNVQSPNGMQAMREASQLVASAQRAIGNVQWGDAEVNDAQLGTDLDAVRHHLDNAAGRLSTVIQRVRGLTSRAAGAAGMARTAQADEYEIGFLERGPSGNPLDASGDWPLAEADPYKVIRPRRDLTDSSWDSIGGSLISDDGLSGKKRKMVDDVSSGVAEVSDDELAGIDEKDDPAGAGVALDDDLGVDAAEPKEDFQTVNVVDVDVGASKMRQVILSFDPNEFSDSQEAKTGAARWVLSHYPSLFSYREPGSKTNIGIEDHLTVSMNEGRVVAMFPAKAFVSGDLKAA